jgi:hypothetical protein
MLASFGQMSLTVGATDDRLKKVYEKLRESETPADKQNRLEILGSEEAITVEYPTEKEAKAIPSNPPWCRLLFLYRKSFPQDSEYVSNEIQRAADMRESRQVRLLDSLDVWRILCAEVSERGTAPSDTNEIHVNNMMFRVTDSKPPLGRLSTELTDQDTRHLTTTIPSLAFAKQILRNGQVTPGGGYCGEKYYSSENFETVTFPLAFCMVRIDREHQLYPEKSFVWGGIMQASLIVIVRDIWSSREEITKGGYNMRDVVKEYCDELSPQDWVVITSDLDKLQWYKLRAEAERYFAENSLPFEIGDVDTLLKAVEHRQTRTLQQTWIGQVNNVAESHFQERAPWLLLAALLNLGWNWQRATSLYKPFTELVSQEYCSI